MATKAGQLRPLTRRQREVLAYVEDYVALHRFPPTSRELSVACSLGSPSGAHRMIRALERKGYLERSPGLSRALTIVRPEVELSTLSLDDMFLVANMTEAQEVARDCALHMAAQVDDPETKGALIRDALERHELVMHVERAMVGVPPEISSSAGPMQTLFHTLRAEATWPIFVVDHLIYDRASSIVLWRLAEEGPVFDLVFGRVARFCERASERAQVWLDQLMASGDPAELEVLRQRAETMMKICEFTARALEKRGPKHRLHFTELMNLPPMLDARPAPSAVRSTTRGPRRSAPRASARA